MMTPRLSLAPRFRLSLPAIALACLLTLPGAATFFPRVQAQAATADELYAYQLTLGQYCVTCHNDQIYAGEPSFGALDLAAYRLLNPRGPSRKLRMFDHVERRDDVALDRHTPTDLNLSPRRTGEAYMATTWQSITTPHFPWFQVRDYTWRPSLQTQSVSTSVLWCMYCRSTIPYAWSMGSARWIP